MSKPVCSRNISFSRPIHSSNTCQSRSNVSLSKPVGKPVCKPVWPSNAILSKTALPSKVYSSKPVCPSSDCQSKLVTPVNACLQSRKFVIKALILN